MKRKCRDDDPNCCNIWRWVELIEELEDKLHDIRISFQELHQGVQLSLRDMNEMFIEIKNITGILEQLMYNCGGVARIGR